MITSKLLYSDFNGTRCALQGLYTLLMLVSFLRLRRMQRMFLAADRWPIPSVVGFLLVDVNGRGTPCSPPMFFVYHLPPRCRAVWFNITFIGIAGYSLSRWFLFITCGRRVPLSWFTDRWAKLGRRFRSLICAGIPALTSRHRGVVQL